MDKLKKIILKIPFSVKIYHSIKSILAYPGYLADFLKFRRLSKIRRFSIKWSDQFPCLIDKTSNTPFEPHYTYHPAWAARVVAEVKPEYHVDIASTLQFCGIVSAFVPVKFYDYRPAKLSLSNLTSERADLTNLHFASNSIKSLSCMHTVEHVGLGRYGDPLDPEGDLKAIKELKRVLAPGGSLIFVVPVGKPKIEFNAHRIYAYEQIVEYFKDLKLKEFSLVPDNFKETGLIRNASPDLVKKQEWGCGCFWFVK